MTENPSNTNPECLLALADRCEREEPSEDLNFLIAQTFPVVVGNPRLRPYTNSLDAAERLIPEGWLLENLSDIWGDGMIWCRLCCPEPLREAVAFGTRNRALAMCAAALRARAVLSKATEGR